jgi:large subunit ribosomal protein L32
MAVPFRRTSKTKKRMRRTHLKKEVGTLTTCPNCKTALRPHRMCPKCGYYKGKEVVAKEENKEVKPLTKKVNEPKKIVKKEVKKVTSTPEKVTKKTTLTRTTSK